MTLNDFSHYNGMPLFDAEHLRNGTRRLQIGASLYTTQHNLLNGTE